MYRSGKCPIAAMLVCCFACAFAAKAQPVLDSLKQSLPLMRSDTDKVWMLRDIAYYSLPHEPDSAIHYSRRGLNVARSIGFHQGALRNMYQAALAYEHKEMHDSAFANYHRAIQLADNVGDGEGKVDMLNALGVACYYAGRMTEATRCYARAYAAADSLGYQQKAGYSLNNMGVIYRMQGKLAQALDVYEKSLRIKRLQRDTAGIVNSLYNLGLIHSSQQSHDLSLSAFKEAQQLARYLEGQEVDVARIGVGMGVAYFNLGMRDKAREQLEAGMLNMGASEPYMYAAGTAYLGMLDVASGIHAQGIQRIEEAYASAKSAGWLELLLQISKQRAQAAELVGDYPLASTAWKAYSQLADSLRSRDANSLREEMEARFELKDKEITIAGQQWQLELEMLRNRRMLTAALCFLLIAIGCGVLAILLRKQQIKLRQSMAITEKALSENELLMREMHHRTKNNLQLLHSLFNLHRRGTDNADAREILQAGSDSVEAIGLLHHHLYVGGDFRKVNIKFYLQDLAIYFRSAFALDERGIAFELRSDDIDMDIEQAIPLGIVINELSTNAVKHAFPEGRKGCISLKVHCEDDLLHLALSDDGAGRQTNGKQGAGSKLMELFQKKLKAELRRDTGAAGTAIHLSFKLKPCA